MMLLMELAIGMNRLINPSKIPITIRTRATVMSVITFSLMFALYPAEQE